MKDKKKLKPLYIVLIVIGAILSIPIFYLVAKLTMIILNAIIGIISLFFTLGNMAM